MNDIKKDIFIIPSGNKYIVYLPLRGVAFYANNKTITAINSYLENGLFPYEVKNTTLFRRFQQLERIEIKESDTKCVIDTSDKVMFILSQMCNLACSYCYAQESRSKEVLSKEKIKAVVDYILSSNEDHSKTFSFIGGGEPMLTWGLLVWAINYITEETNQKKIKKSIGITTNATLLNEERILWLKKMNVKLCVSYDILPEIQNSQRNFSMSTLNSFDVVDKNIHLLLKHEVPFRLRSTITNKNVELMVDMVQFTVKNYPNINQLHFEPVSDTIENSNLYYEKFVKKFIEAYNVARENNIFVYNSILNSFFRIRKQFCVGELCVTPTGDIVSCHRHSTEKDIAFSSFQYGRVEDGSVCINQTSFHNAITVRQNRFNDCETCFAKWHCAGGCISIRKTLSSEQQMFYCRFIKSMLISFLENKLLKKEVNYGQVKL